MEDYACPENQNINLKGGTVDFLGNSPFPRERGTEGERKGIAHVHSFTHSFTCT
jgi:hypothetical protein